MCTGMFIAVFIIVKSSINYTTNDKINPGDYCTAIKMKEVKLKGTTVENFLMLSDRS
jgi:hypothetical protein